MKIGFVGLGKMGLNMVTRLIQNGYETVVFDLNPEAVRNAEEKGAQGAGSLDDVVNRLDQPRIVWIMVPAGRITKETVMSLASFLKKGDIISDGGNTFYKYSMRQAQELKNKGISLLDAGTSGGIWGLKIGYCLMVGGEETAFKKAEPIFRALAPKDGYAYVGPSGA